MTYTQLQKIGTKIDEHDFNDGLYTDCYGGTVELWQVDNEVYKRTYHNNQLTYTGETKTELLIDDLEGDKKKYNDLYFKEKGFTDDWCEKNLQ